MLRSHVDTAPKNETATDPVLPDQGGRMTKADPGHVQPKSDDHVRLRAYEIYELRGRKDGSALEDWLLAETEIENSAA